MLLKALTSYLARDERPNVELSRCLNYHCPDQCRRCADACPTAAITADKKLEINEQRCNSCGTCCAACPTHCLQIEKLDWTAIYNECLKLSFLQLGCRKSADLKTNIIIPCLGAVPAEFFVSLATLKPKSFILDLTPCKTCLNRKALKQLQKSLRKATKLIGKPLLFKTAPDNSGVLKNGAFINRSDIQLLKRNCHFLLKEVADCAVDASFLSVPKPKTDSSADKLLTKLFIDNQDVSINLPSWKLSAACNGCGRCRGICPVGAWEIEQEQDQGKLIHHPTRCKACKLCSKQCPQRAMTQVYINVNNSCLKGKVVHTFETKRCTRCLAIIEKDHPETLCASCKNKSLLQNKILLDLRSTG